MRQHQGRIERHALRAGLADPDEPEGDQRQRHEEGDADGQPGAAADARQVLSDRLEVLEDADVELDREPDREGDAILLLNPDAYLRDPDAVAVALAHLDAHPQVGAVGLRLVFEDGRHQVGDAGFEPRPLTVAVHAAGLSGRFGLRGVYLSGGQARAPGPVSVDWLCGAFLMLRREAVEAIGGLSSPLFLYGEDVDWGCRVRDAGWRVEYLPDRSVVHLQGGSGSTRSPRWLDGLAGVYRLRNGGRRLSSPAFFAVPLWLGFTARAAVYGLLGRLRRRPDLLGRSRDMKRFADHLTNI
ncbi:glycosyltransferase family 2 protein [Methylobacterium sp. WL122]|nr:glycosyltransferase family 2 protein [Methylobacterium sp. WL122]